MKKRKQNKFIIRHSLYEIDNIVNYKRSILLTKIIESRLLGVETCSYQWVFFSLQYLNINAYIHINCYADGDAIKSVKML